MRQIVYHINLHTFLKKLAFFRRELCKRIYARCIQQVKTPNREKIPEVHLDDVL